MTIGQTTDRPVLDGDAARSRVDDVVRVALTVPGVTAVRVEPDADGSALVRLELSPGADEAQVAGAVEQALAADAAVGPVAAPGKPASDTAPGPAPEPAFGPAFGPGREPGPGPVALTSPVPAAPAAAPAAEDTGEAPAAASAAAAGRPGHRLPMPSAAPERTTDRPRTGRISVPPLSSSSVAATPAPQWLGDAAPAPRPEGGDRLVLDRVEVVTQGLSTTATVVLAAPAGGALHTGVSEAANTPAGGPRALATATLRALESAAAGRLRGEVEAVRTSELDGRAAVTVMLGIATARGSEQLVGAALEGGTQPAVVRAVLSACNRRLGPDLH